MLRRTQRPGLKALLREAGLDEKPLTSVSIGYTLAPRINASGRMGCASLAAELLLTEDPGRAEELSHELCELNRERQAIEGEIFAECLAIWSRRPCPGAQRPALVLAGEGWHQGVVGIVASRLAEKYSCPAFMICLQDGRGKGSCRSFGGFNLFAALEQCADLLEGYGGHALAAGFTIREENIPAFRAADGATASEAWSGGAEMVSALEMDAELPDPDLLTLEEVEGLDAAGALRRRQPQARLFPVGLHRLCRQRGGGRTAPEAEGLLPRRPELGRHLLLRHRRRRGRGRRGPGGRGLYPPDQRVPGLADGAAPAVRPAPRPHPGPGRAGPL